MWQPARNTTKSSTYRLHWQVKKSHCGCCPDAYQNRSWHFLEELHADNHYRQRSCTHNRRSPIQCVEILRDRSHAVKEIAGDMLHPQAKEISDLRAGDQNRNAVSEAH